MRRRRVGHAFLLALGGTTRISSLSIEPVKTSELVRGARRISSPYIARLFVSMLR